MLVNQPYKYLRQIYFGLIKDNTKRLCKCMSINFKDTQLIKIVRQTFKLPGRVLLQKTVQTLLDLYKKETLTINQKNYCNKLLGYAYHNISNYLQAKYYLHLYFSELDYINDPHSFLVLMICYCRQNKRQIALGNFNQLLIKHPNNQYLQKKYQQILIKNSQKYTQTITKCLQYKNKYQQFLSYYLLTAIITWDNSVNQKNTVRCQLNKIYMFRKQNNCQSKEKREKLSILQKQKAECLCNVM